MTERVRYTRERLTDAASQCADIGDVMRFFGMQPSDKLRRYLLKRFAHYDIDISHFAHRTGSRPPDPEVLRRAAAESTSIAGVLRRLGRPDTGTQRRRLRTWIAECRISTAHFLGQAHARGKPGPTPFKSAREILVRHEGGYRSKSHLLRRALREVGVPDECATCGTGPTWLGGPMTLEIDHVNGDWNDDRRENLRLLCPNCHAVTDTWCRGGRRVQ
ncbi:HNH endonuclease [Streptomyces sp. NPDC051771]|uniref:HNH endonuclease signature motif containing protein n=1 Tax=Streptomyces sp. NPDC051771 TaxID=3154847 RepID=UPI003416DECB